MHIYNKKFNGEIHVCEVCTKKGILIQHHIGGKTYDDRAIWVHNLCHKKIHNPTAYGLPGDWAYNNNYLLRRSNTMVKEKKEKTCSHSKTYNRFINGKMVIKCNYCGKDVNQVSTGAHKNKKPIQIGIDLGEGTSRTVKVKMGQEIQDPRVKRAEDLKKSLITARIQAKKNCYNKDKYESWQNKIREIKISMNALQSSYEE